MFLWENEDELPKTANLLCSFTSVRLCTLVFQVSACQIDAYHCKPVVLGRPIRRLCSELNNGKTLRLTDFVGFKSQMYRSRRRDMSALAHCIADIDLLGTWSNTIDNDAFVTHQDDIIVILGTN